MYIYMSSHGVYFVLSDMHYVVLSFVWRHDAC